MIMQNLYANLNSIPLLFIHATIIYKYTRVGTRV